jgi:probable phosphoglycerate mutase
MAPRSSGNGRATMKTILLVRHGTHAEVGLVLSGRSEIPLDGRGRREADALAAAVDCRAISSLHSSPRARARQTAAPIAERRAMRVIVTPALDEIDFGAFTGRSFAALAPDPDWQRWNAERATARCPGGETMAEASDRALAYLRQLGDEDAPALCVTHCDIIRALVVRALGLGFERMLEFDCDPASCTTLEIGDGDMRIVTLNERHREKTGG